MNDDYINLKVCPAYAYDYLSILQVKCIKFLNEINRSNYIKTYNNIADEIGEELNFKIIDSQEYKDLCMANKKVFELVDLAKKNDICASQVVIANDKRTEMKRELQRKFFPDIVFNEQKF